MLIRYMQKEDVPEVAVIEKDLFTDPWTADDFLSSLAQKDTCFVTMLGEDGSIAGFCGGYCAFEEVEIVNVSVRRDLQGHGYGQAMVRELMALRQAQGSTNFILEVRKSNLPAQTVYAHCGFEKIGIRKGFYDRPKEDAVIMQRLVEEA